MSATARRARGAAVTEFAPSTGEYQLTELKNVSTSRTSNTNSVEFHIRLVQAVREHPCFYDPNDPHYDTRHQRHRSAVWHQVVNGLGYSGDTNSLLQQWRKLLAKYTKERRGEASATEEHLDTELAAEMAWLDEFVLDGMPASSSTAAAATPAEQPPQQLFFMEGEEEDILGDDFVDQHEYQVEDRLEDETGRTSPAGSAHSGTGSDIDVGGVGCGPVTSSHTLLIPKEQPGTSSSRGETIGMTSHGSGHRTAQSGRQAPVTSGGVSTTQSYRFVNASSSSHHAHPAEGITVSSRGNGTMIAHPKKEGGGSTLTMVIDPTTYYQNGTQKMYRLVNVADLDQSQHTLQHLRPAGGLGGGSTLIAEPASFSVGRGTRKRMGAPLSPPSHAMLGGPSSSSADHHTSPYGKPSGQLGDELILDDGIVGENTIVIDQQRDDDSPLLVDSPGMHQHHHHMMMGGSGPRSMHRSQHSPTLLGNGAGPRGSGAYSPGLSNQAPSFNTSQYDADLALQHFISSHLARMNEDDKSLAKLNIQRILLDARFGQGTTLRVCMGEEDAELANAAVASEMVTDD